MKKVLFVLLLGVLLVACSNDADESNVEHIEAEKKEEDGEELTAHINIDNEVIGDSYQTMRVIEKFVEGSEELDLNVLNGYQEKYIEDYDVDQFTDEETELILITGLLISNRDDFATIASERENFEEYKNRWYETLETGEDPKEY